MTFFATGFWGWFYIASMALCAAVVMAGPNRSMRDTMLQIFLNWLGTRVIIASGHDHSTFYWLILHLTTIAAISVRSPDSSRAVAVWYGLILGVNTLGLFTDITGEGYKAIFDALGIMALITAGAGAHDDGNGVFARAYRSGADRLSSILAHSQGRVSPVAIHSRDVRKTDHQTSQW